MKTYFYSHWKCIWIVSNNSAQLVHTNYYSSSIYWFYYRKNIIRRKRDVGASNQCINKTQRLKLTNFRSKWYCFHRYFNGKGWPFLSAYFGTFFHCKKRWNTMKSLKIDGGGKANYLGHALAHRVVCVCSPTLKISTASYNRRRTVWFGSKCEKSFEK